MEVGRPLSTLSEKRWLKALRRVNEVSTRPPSSSILIWEILASATAWEANRKKHRSASFALIKNRSLPLPQGSVGDHRQLHIRRFSLFPIQRDPGRRIPLGRDGVRLVRSGHRDADPVSGGEQ